MFRKDETFTEFKIMNKKVLNFNEEKNIFKKAKSQKSNKKYKSNSYNKNNETQNDKNKVLS